VEAVTDTETVDDWKNDKLLQEIQFDLCDIHNADERGVSIYNLVTGLFCGNTCHGQTKLKQQVTVLLYVMIIVAINYTRCTWQLY
jgi:hypothetical protein